MARAKSEFLRSFGKSFEIFKRIAEVVMNLGGSDEDLTRLLTDADRVRRIGEIIVEQPKASESDYFTPLVDAEAPEHYWALFNKYRRLAREHGVPDFFPVCYRVRAGFTLKQHAPKSGMCREDFKNLQNWNFPDEPTGDSLVFWVPRIISGSTLKTENEQLLLLADIRTGCQLPKHHLNGFGKISLVAGLILAHYRTTGERIPLNNNWVRTDTRSMVGGRLNLGHFNHSGLSCHDGWGYDSKASVEHGTFALGVEVLET